MAQPVLRQVRSVVVVRPVDVLPVLLHDSTGPGQRIVTSDVVPVSICVSQQDGGGYKVESAPGVVPFFGDSLVFPAVYGESVGGLPLETLCHQELEPLLQGCFRGESAAAIAYGQTGAGKSFLCGTEWKTKAPWSGSIASYVAHRLWDIGSSKQSEESSVKDMVVECSMTEIYREGSYKEAVYDLLSGPTRIPLQGYAEAKLHRVWSPQELLSRLADGSALRNTDATGSNARSSRSHAIYTIKVQHTREIARVGGQKTSHLVTGRLLVVDLAGAEAASEAPPGTRQQRQGSGINVGLSALQLVIRDVAKDGTSSHYRASKLTYLLKPALGGEGGRSGCAAVFFGCVSPLPSDATRALHTLQYMQKAGQITNIITQDVECLDRLREATLKAEIDRLKEENAHLRRLVARAGNGTGNTPCSLGQSREEEEVVVLSTAKYNELINDLQQCKDRAAAFEVAIGAQKGSAGIQKAVAISPILAAGEVTRRWSMGVNDIGDLCLSGEQSHMTKEQLQALRALVEVRMQTEQVKGDDEGFDVDLACRHGHDTVLWEVCKLIVASYNECLGASLAEAAELQARLGEAEDVVQQAAIEKVSYVNLAAKFQHALDISQFDVVELQAELRGLRSSPSAASTGPSSPAGRLLRRVFGYGKNVASQDDDASDSCL
jgi:hypothetical protein